MSDLLRERIRERIAALGTNPFEVAKKAGFERSFVNDLLIGKKQTIREKRLPALSEVLECDPEYLAGSQATPRRGNSAAAGGLGLAGICEAGSWREIGFPLPNAPALPIEADPRFSQAGQAAFLVRGDHAAGIGIPDGSIICIATLDAISAEGRRLHDGDAVLVRRERDGSQEFSARIFEESREGVRLVAYPGRGSFPTVSEGPGVEIAGLILRSIKVFGRAS